MTIRFQITNGPFPAKISHLNKGEQDEYDKTYEKRQAIHKKQVAPSDDEDAQKNIGKCKDFYKTSAAKDLALYNNGRILNTLLLRSQERIEHGLPIPPTMISAETEHRNAKADRAAKKAATDIEKAADALLRAAMGSEDEAEEEDAEEAEEKDIEDVDEEAEKEEIEDVDEEGDEDGQ